MRDSLESSEEIAAELSELHRTLILRKALRGQTYGSVLKVTPTNRTGGSYRSRLFCISTELHSLQFRHDSSTQFRIREFVSYCYRFAKQQGIIFFLFFL